LVWFCFVSFYFSLVCCVVLRLVVFRFVLVRLVLFSFVCLSVVLVGCPSVHVHFLMVRGLGHPLLYLSRSLANLLPSISARYHARTVVERGGACSSFVGNGLRTVFTVSPRGSAFC
jgi:hypothetical protein